MVDTMKDERDFHQSLMDSAYERWRASKWTYEEFLGYLSELEKAAVMLGNLNYQVCNGGWCQWIENGYIDTADLLLAVLDSMTSDCPLAPTVARMVRDAVKAKQDEEKLDPFDYYYEEVEGYDDDGEEITEEYQDTDAHEAAVQECYAQCDENDDLFYTFNSDFMVQCEVWLRYKAGQEIPTDVLNAHEPALTRSVEEAPRKLSRKPRVKLVGCDSNAFSVMSACARALHKAGYPKEEINRYRKEAMGGSYEHLLAVSMEWCEAY